jgi:hypothetical protein
VSQHGASSASTRESPEEDSSAAWLPVDIVVNYIGEELALAFCHAVVGASSGLCMKRPGLTMLYRPQCGGQRRGAQDVVEQLVRLLGQCLGR